MLVAGHNVAYTYFYFPWDDCYTQQKLETTVNMQNFVDWSVFNEQYKNGHCEQCGLRVRI